MKDSRLLIQDVVLAKCGGVVNNSKDNEKCVQVIEFTFEKTITCVVDKINNVAIDIETCKVWPIIKRDENNRIVDDLIQDQLYPIKFIDKNWDEISYLYQISLKARAKDIYQRYLKNKEIDKMKIKKKTKEN